QFDIPYDAEVEHVLPKKWNNYDGWTEITHQKDVNKLGNLVILEKKLNISAKNEFFERKKKEYRKSCVLGAKKLCKIKTWDEKVLARRDDRVIEELVSFFNEI
ncbi:MAG: HNH endonuclease family protein, partial [Desulfovibrionaceae bacterium]|nr:HNH endonuclease family protein [Desulfovibrionaceae bacterium]